MNTIELEKIKQKALNEHIPIIMDDTLEVIAKILTEKKPKRILEIGAAVGYSAMRFSKYLAEDGLIDTIERDEERIEEAKQNFKKVEVENKINLYEGDAVEILPTLNEKYDVVFIDAAKGKYPFFLKEALRMLKQDGIIFADLLFGGSGKWENENRGKYSIPTITTSKEYYVSQNSYTNNLGGTAEVLSPTGKGNNRFYIMSLSDIDSNTHTWYAGAYDGGIEDYNIITSKEFCASKSNSITMIKKWNSSAYGNQNSMSKYTDV